MLLDLRQVDEAEAIARPVFARSPRDVRAGLVLARAAADRGDWAAVLTLTEPIRDHPAARKRAALFRADALRAQGRFAEADAEAARAAAASDDVLPPDEYVREVEAMRVGTGADIQNAIDLLDSGRPAAAIALLERATATARNPTRVRLLLGQAYIETSNPIAARDVLTKVVQADPDSVDGWFQLGVARYFTADPAGAAEAFTRVVELKPDHALAHFNLGHARKQLGDRRGAEAAFAAALHCRPDHEPSQQALADLRAGK